MEGTPVGNKIEEQEDKLLSNVIAQLEKREDEGELVQLLMELSRNPKKTKELLQNFNAESLNWNYFLTLKPEEIREVILSLKDFLNPKEDEARVSEGARRTTRILSASE